MIKKKKIHCNTCKNETNHQYIAESERSYHEVENYDGREHLVYQENYEYRFWSCLGCDTALIEEIFNSSGMHDFEGNEIYDYSYYPPRSNILKREPKRFIHIEQSLNSTYKEIIQASNLNL